MREWGAEAVTSLVRSALTHDHNPPLKQDLVSHEYIASQRLLISRLSHAVAFLLKEITETFISIVVLLVFSLATSIHDLESASRNVQCHVC